MHCYICDKQMTEAEIQIIPDTSKLHNIRFDCCPSCLNVALEAAYCDGFVAEESLDEVENLDEDYEGLDEHLMHAYGDAFVSNNPRYE